jgi:hypothetical protein
MQGISVFEATRVAVSNVIIENQVSSSERVNVITRASLDNHYAILPGVKSFITAAPTKTQRGAAVIFVSYHWLRLCLLTRPEQAIRANDRK